MHDFLTGNTFSGNYDLLSARGAGFGRASGIENRWRSGLKFRFLGPVILLNSIFAALAVLSLALMPSGNIFAARKFPLHRRIADPAFSPALSILKPLKGCDATTADSLASWFNQDYVGPVQILFGVASADDPVCNLVRELIQKSQADAQLIICGESLGTNAKASTLVQLEKSAKHDLLLV